MRARAGEAGLSLVELLVASAVASLVMGLLAAATFQFVTATADGHDRLAVLRDHGNAFQWLNRDAQMAVSADATVTPSTVTLNWTDAVTGTVYQSDYAQSGDELVRTLTVDGGTPTTQAVARNLDTSGFGASLTGDLLTVSITSVEGETTQTRTESVLMRAAGAATPTPTPTPGPGPHILTAHSETTTISGTGYYQLKEATADGAAMTATTPAIGQEEVGRWILHNSADGSRLAKHVLPLTGISQIEASTWTVNYRARTSGDPAFPKAGQDDDVNLNIDILIRRADGTVRTTLATEVAKAYIPSASAGQWLTLSATYAFPEYLVVDNTDYLEIDYYGQVDVKGPSDGPGYIDLRVDDDTLASADQTRTENVTW